MLSPAGGALWLVRLLILGVAVAATWLTLLAPAHPWHVAYSVSGWYLLVLAGTAVALWLLRFGLGVPSIGLVLWLIGAGLFAVCEGTGLVRRLLPANI